MNDQQLSQGQRRALRAPRPTVVIDEMTIEQAKRRDSSHCMIAEAVKKAVPNATSVSVDLQTIRWTDRDRGLRFTYLTPRLAQLALLKFDQGDEDLAPFAFRLRYAQITKANTKRSQRRTADQDAVPKRAALMGTPHHAEDGYGAEPAVRVGGRTPPIGPLSNTRVRVGKRREFGLRQLTR